MLQISMVNFDQLKNILTTPQHVVITMHMRPDADALGSSLALYHFLQAKGHHVNVIAPTDYPGFLKWLPGNKNVHIYSESNAANTKHLINTADLVYCLDFSTLNRCGDLCDSISGSAAKKVLIDHHLEPESFYDFALWNPKASSTAELIFDFIQLFEEENVINTDIAECIYAGIMTDTGSFRFPSTSPKVHRILADLMDLGIDHSSIHRKIYDDNTESRLRLLGYSLSEKLVINQEAHTAYLSLSQSELNKFNYKQGDTEGIVNYALSVNGIIFAAIILEKENLVKMSFRSVGDFDVNTFARKYFNGGGHKNAAGGRSDHSFKDTISQIDQLINENKAELIECYNKLNEL